MWNTIRDRNTSQWALAAASAGLVYFENAAWAMLAGQGGVLALGVGAVATSEAILQTSEYLAQQLEDSPAREYIQQALTWFMEQAQIRLQTMQMTQAERDQLVRAHQAATERQELAILAQQGDEARRGATRNHRDE